MGLTSLETIQTMKEPNFQLCSRDNESYHLVQNFKTTL